jgi:hypothetical protein
VSVSFFLVRKKREGVAGRNRAKQGKKKTPKASGLQSITYNRNKNPLEGSPYLVMDCHAASCIFLKNLSYPIGKSFILQLRFLFTLFFLHEKQGKTTATVDLFLLKGLQHTS